VDIIIRNPGLYIYMSHVHCAETIRNLSTSRVSTKNFETDYEHVGIYNISRPFYLSDVVIDKLC
jgi:hypothetical protein